MVSGPLGMLAPVLTLAPSACRTAAAVTEPLPVVGLNVLMAAPQKSSGTAARHTSGAIGAWVHWRPAPKRSISPTEVTLETFRPRPGESRLS